MTNKKISELTELVTVDDLDFIAIVDESLVPDATRKITRHNFLKSDDILLDVDNRKIIWGATNQASVFHDGTNVVFNLGEIGGGSLILQQYNATPDILFDDDQAAGGAVIAAMRFRGHNSTPADVIFGQIRIQSPGITPGSENGKIAIRVLESGTERELVEFRGDTGVQWAFLNHTFNSVYVDMDDMAEPADPAAGSVRYYSKQIDANNNALFVKKEIGGAIVEVEI